MPRSTAERSAAYRQRRRSQGLKPVTFWVHDPLNPDYRRRIALEMEILNASDARDPTVKAWLDDVVNDLDGWSA